MEYYSLPTIILIGITVIVSLLAFNNPRLLNDFTFYPYRMWRDKEWYRIITSGFIHGSGPHLFFNMFALFSFGSVIDISFVYEFGAIGRLYYLLMYIIAIMVSDLFELFTRKDDYAYRALGASGGVSAVVFASILLEPRGEIGLLLIPGINIPAYIFGGLYLFYCVYMAKNGRDNIGHTAHFIGAVFGFCFPALFKPQLILDFISKIKGAM